MCVGQGKETVHFWDKPIIGLREEEVGGWVVGGRWGGGWGADERVGFV